METSRRSSASASLDDPSPSTRPILTRGPSIYQGAEERVIAEVLFAAQRVGGRTQALLECFFLSLQPILALTTRLGMPQGKGPIFTSVCSSFGPRVQHHGVDPDFSVRRMY